MKCPDCNHEFGKSLMKCSACGTAVEREVLERFEHLQYLVTWLDDQTSLLDEAGHGALRGQALSQLEVAQRRLKGPEIDLSPPVTLSPAEVAERAHQLALVKAARDKLTAAIAAGRTASRTNSLTRSSTRTPGKLKHVFFGVSRCRAPPRHR